jgi:protein-disulfide isomerase
MLWDTRRTSLGSAAALVVLVASCTSQADVDEIKRNQALLKSNQGEIKDRQRRILEKLDRLGAGSQAGKPATPAPVNAAAKPKPRPGAPDPAKTYAFAAGDSPSKGPKDAWVTIVEVSEFQ